MANQDPTHLKNIKDLLNQCPNGRDAVQCIDNRTIPVLFDPVAPGAQFDPVNKEIVINRAQSVNLAALNLVHEANHAEWKMSGLSPDVHTAPDQGIYVHQRIDEEAVGTVKAIKAQMELEAQGVKFAAADQYPLYDEYKEARDQAIDGLVKANPKATALEQESAGEKAGLDAVRDGFTTGVVTGFLVFVIK